MSDKNTAEAKIERKTIGWLVKMAMASDGRLFTESPADEIKKVDFVREQKNRGNPLQIGKTHPRPSKLATTAKIQ